MTQPDPRPSDNEADTVRRLANPEFALHYLREHRAEVQELQLRCEIFDNATMKALADRDQLQARVQELERERDRLKEALEGDTLTAKRVNQLLEQRDELQAEVERLKRELENAKTLWARSIEQVCEEQTEALRLREALELIAAPKRPDGTYNRSREACEQLARQALAAHSPVDNADAPAPPDMSTKQEKSDTLAGHVDGRDTSSSRSETAGTKPTCAPTPEQVRRLEAEARKAAAEQGFTDSDDGCTSASNEELAFIAGAKWALRDSGGRG